MKLTERFSVSNPDIVHETIDGEVVIVNLRNGFYYSCDRIGSVIWNFVESGFSYGEIVSAFVDRYPQNPEMIEQATARLIGDLCNEGLIVRAAGSQDTTTLAEPMMDLVDADFVAPVLQKHKDMQELLLVDPIHDVADSGWPNKK